MHIKNTYKGYETTVPDKNSAAVLRAMKGLRLCKIGYIEPYNYSLKTILIFENKYIKVYNDVVFDDKEVYIEEISRLAFCETEAPIDDIAYETDEDGVMWLDPDLSKGMPENPGKYEYRQYDKTIRDISLVHDHYDFIDRDTDDRYIGDACLIAILYFTDGSHLLIATGITFSTIEALGMFDDINVMDGYFSYNELHGIDPDDGERNLKVLDNYREIIPIDEYDPDKYTVE